MTTLTHALLDVADCNTTLHYLGASSPREPLPFADADGYTSLYEMTATGPVEYASIAGHPGAMLRDLRSAFTNNRYWHRAMRSRDVATYPSGAWARIVPVAATLTKRIEVILPPGIDVVVSPLPRVLLHPFGWCVWISFRIIGNFGLDDLAKLVRHLCGEPAYRFGDESLHHIDLTRLFDDIASGVREDVFGGSRTPVENSQELFTVATVVAKHGGSPSLGGLTADHETAMKEIVHPRGKPSRKPLASLAKPLWYGDSLLNFAVHDRTSWFLWAENLLEPVGRNAAHLRCYHNNTFLTLLQAWAIENFLIRALATKPWSAALSELAGHAVSLLDAPSYKNFSLCEYLERKESRSLRSAVKRRLS